MIGLLSMWEIGLYSAMAPLLLLLVTSVWAYPAVLEEVVKWALLKMDGAQVNLRSGVIVGVIFGLSEAVLYSANAFESGNFGVLAMRVLLTVPMHTVTGVVTAIGMKQGMGRVGLVVAMVIHAGFNYFAG